jgi:hypothetical protein
MMDNEAGLRQQSQVGNLSQEVYEEALLAVAVG